MTDSSIAPCPIKRLDPAVQSEIIVSKCLKCGNEIRVDVTGMTREHVEAAIDKLDGQMGECPGGFHVELSGWRRIWDLDKAVEKHFGSR